uniref:MHC class I antigen n=1 Tax=Mesocestoides corti TaxID=53468 RepID=A0A5K3FIU1_MESCO
GSLHQHQVRNLFGFRGCGQGSGGLQATCGHWEQSLTRQLTSHAHNKIRDLAWHPSTTHRD